MTRKGKGRWGKLSGDKFMHLSGRFSLSRGKGIGSVASEHTDFNHFTVLLQRRMAKFGKCEKLAQGHSKCHNKGLTNDVKPNALDRHTNNQKSSEKVRITITQHNHTKARGG